MSKKKGTRAERELFHLLWESQWAVVRSAGSGSTQKPSPDLITSNGKRILAIECKSIKTLKKYFCQEEILQLNKFSKGFGAEPWIGIRFDKKGWFFVPLNKLPQSKGQSFSISWDFAQKQGISFEELIGKYSQIKL